MIIMRRNLNLCSLKIKNKIILCLEIVIRVRVINLLRSFIMLVPGLFNKIKGILSLKILLFLIIRNRGQGLSLLLIFVFRNLWKVRILSKE